MNTVNNDKELPERIEDDPTVMHMISVSTDEECPRPVPSDLMAGTSGAGPTMGEMYEALHREILQLMATKYLRKLEERKQRWLAEEAIIVEKEKRRQKKAAEPKPHQRRNG